MSAPDLDESVLARLREQVGASTVERLIELFRANVRDRQEAVRVALGDGDRHALGVAFHSIKGSAQQVGARRLEEISARWEEEARSGDLDTTREALGEIAECFAGVERALETSVDSAGSD